MTKKATSSPAAAQDLLSQFVNGMRGKFETDPVLETEKGVDIEVEGYGTFTILRANSRNKNFIEAYRAKVAPYEDSPAAKALEKAKKDDPIKAQLNREVFAETLIIGLKTADGQSIPYDDQAKAAVAELLKNAPDLYAQLQSDAVNADNFRKQVEAEEKN